MRKGRFIIGILCLIAAGYSYVNIISPKFDYATGFCLSGMAEMMNVDPLCRVIYFGWFLIIVPGIAGIALLISSRSHYYGTRNPKFRR